MNNVIHRRSRIFGLPENTQESNVQILRVRVICASDLVRKDLFGLSDPYVKLILQTVGRGGSVVDFSKTRIIPKTLNPQWNEEFLFRVNPDKHRLLLELYDSNRLLKDDFLGQVVLKLTTGIFTEVNASGDLPCSESGEPILPIRAVKLQKKAVFNRVKGQILLSVTFLHNPSIRRGRAGSNHSTNDIPGEGGGGGSTGREIAAGTSTRTTSTETGTSPSDRRRGRSTNSRSAATGAADQIISNVTLPEGWEARRDRNGRTYYVDHNARTTSWHLPSHLRAQSENEENHEVDDDSNVAGNFSLPPGWQISYTQHGRMFFINHNQRITTWVDPRTGIASSDTSSGSANTPSVPRPSVDFNQDLGSLPPGWEMRLHVDGRVFFIDHNNKKTQWEDPRLEKFAGPAVPYSRDFEEKVKYFRKNLPRPKSYVGSQVELQVSRASILETSFRAVMPFRDPEYLRARLWVVFDGEKGLDYGGVAREWFHLLSKELFNPFYGLFIYSALNNYTLQINPYSGVVNEEHLRYFVFVGRIVGMAIYHNKLIEAFFVSYFYKMMLERPVTLVDLESVDKQYYNSLKWILENDPEPLDMYFSVSEDVFGEMKEVELVPGGRDIQVVENNKREFANKVIEWRLNGRVKKQMDHFMFGFNEIIPKDDIKLFDTRELELLISGIGEINVSDWKKHTLYKGEYSAHHPVVQWFWRAVLSMSNERRIRLLQFVTGTSRLPMNGFHELWGSNGPQWFTVEKWGDRSKLPRSHTCFNRIDLPPYENFDELRDKLIIAIEMSEGFEGVD